MSQQALLFPHLSVAANVAYAPRCQGRSRSAARSVALDWLDGGRRQRRWPIGGPPNSPGARRNGSPSPARWPRNPRLLLLDEPMAALDVAASSALRRLLHDILREQKRTAILVTHEVLDAVAIADEAVVIDGGRVVESGPVRAVLAAPRSAFGARIAGVNLVAGVTATPGLLRTGWGADLAGTGDLEAGVAAVALFRPSAVSVHLEPPHGSPRNVVPVTIAEMDVRGPVVRIRGAEQPDGGTGLAADVTAAAAADLALAPGRNVYFVVKAQEVDLHPAPR